MIQIERNPNFEGTWIEGQSSEDYHADKTAIGSSQLRKILKSPRTFYSHFTGQIKQEENPALNFGSAVHMAILEPKKFFNSYVKQPDFGDLRSPRNRTIRDEWKAAQAPGAVILNLEDYQKMEGILNSVLKHRDANALLKNGIPEMSGYFADPVTGLKCKIKPDFFNDEIMTMIDVKTTQDCSIDEFSKSIWKYRYDVQFAFYAEGIKNIMGRSIDHAVFLVVEKTPPFECAIYIADESVLGKGDEDMRKALGLLSECLKNNHWPAYQENLQPIALPHWAINKN